ncbi:hypothetical protein SPRG_14251 [Saprolegnia parasitica CBS 223.65]|uniref:Uncharacterized protein n=1 Tax=Saprolegnia parasitica (strain CBS 223.65) TaxID=695850 RepID=A0A067BMP7_SAPPC|nr:hypothetical protein SPRG_14251 [Saprolegnia parasitica CBS 223.65]KDO19724.1 hypothetical protein SPRG_14251 [Saprolegnia parasitica CBS 223.65]|eukprot:XP_012209583.1 hypothetical protein SPRG_14251 [Saprolegnia parasitica CBS 223.65]
MPTPWAESADLVARFRALDSAGVVGDALVPSSPPPPATARLDTHGLVWSDLTALAKEALLWDMGLVRASTFPDDVAQVYTACAGTSNMGDSMASIAVSEAAFLASQANATVRACAGADGNYSRQENAHGMFLGKVVKCAVPLLPDTTTPNSYASMWAQDGLDATTVPDPRLWRHEWHSIGFPSFLLYAIHTVPAQFAETAWGKCPSATSPGSLIVPCTVYKPSNYSSMVFSPPNVEWCLPRPSTAMDAWLAAIHDAKTHRDTPDPASCCWG